MEKKILIPGVLSSFFVMVFHTLIGTFFYEKGMNNNVYWILLCVIFLLSYIGLSILERNKNFRLSGITKYFGCVILALFIIWFGWMYYKEITISFFDFNYSLRHRIPMLVYFLILIATVVGIIMLMKYYKRENSKYRIIPAMCMSVLQSIVLLAPNIMNDWNGTLFHIHAYYNPIYNTSDFRATDNIIKSIYGHYSFFYMLPMNLLKMFGVPKIYAAMAITIFVGLISFILLYLALDRLIKKDYIFYLTILAIAHISFYQLQAGQYYQFLPHRIFYPCVLIFLLSRYVNKKMPVWIIICYSMLAMSWNFETGIVCSICIVVFDYLSIESKNEKIHIKRVLRSVCFLMISFASAYLLINIMNLLIGGDFLSIKAFLYPLGSDSFIDSLQLKLPGAYAIYFLEFSVFMSIICFSFFEFLKRKWNGRYTLLLVICLLGMGSSPYYINRPAYGNVCVLHIPFVIVLSLALELLMKRNKQFQKSEGIIGKVEARDCLVICASILLGFYLLGTLSGIPMTIKNRIDSSWKYEGYRAFLKTFSETIPENTPAAGPGLPDIYSTLRWDPQIYLIDWADMDQEVIQYAKKQIASKDSLVFNDSAKLSDYIDWDSWIMVDLLYDQFYYIVKIDDGLCREDFLLKYADEHGYSDEEFIRLCILDCYKRTPTGEYIQYYTDFIMDGIDRETLYYLIYEDYLDVLESQ